MTACCLRQAVGGLEGVAESESAESWSDREARGMSPDSVPDLASRQSWGSGSGLARGVPSQLGPWARFVLLFATMVPRMPIPWLASGRRVAGIVLAEE